MAATLPATPYDREAAMERTTPHGRPPAAPPCGPVGRPGVLAARARRGLADAGCCWPASSSRCCSARRRRSRQFGLGFLWSTEWDPVQDKFGGLVMIYGTLMTSFIALLIAVPVSFGIALFLTELSPALAEAPAGHRHRVARRGAVDRLRHVGSAGVRPDPGHLRAGAAAGAVRRRAAARRACSPGRRWASASCRPASSWRS